MLLVIACTAFAACSPTGAGEAPTVRIAFFQDLSVPDHVDLVSPSFLAYDLALQRRLSGFGLEAEVVQLDTAGDASLALEMARDVAADPSYALAVVAPFWEEPADVARVLADAGGADDQLVARERLAVAGLAVPAGGARRALAPLRARPRSGGRPAGGHRRSTLRRGCGAAGLPGGRREPVRPGTARPGADRPRGWPVASIDAAEPEAAAGAVREAGCPVVVWGGFAPGARSFARALRGSDAARGRPVDLAGDAMKTIVPPTSPAGDGVVVGSVACSCADVSIDLRLSSRRFVNVYQAEHGLSPGVYAAEAWDAGRLTAAASETAGTVVPRCERECARSRSTKGSLAPTPSTTWGSWREAVGHVRGRRHEVAPGADMSRHEPGHGLHA